MNEYHGPYSLWIVELDDSIGIRIDEQKGILGIISSVRSLYPVLRYAKSVVYDKNDQVVDMHVPFMADGLTYDLTNGVGVKGYDEWLKGAK